MAVKKIEKDDWKKYFDVFSQKCRKNHRTNYTEIRVLTEEAGTQPETQWMRLQGINYDPKDDLLDINVENFTRLILHPQVIFVDDDSSDTLTSMEVIEKDGTKDIVEIRDGTEKEVRW